ncbi:MAG: YcxB family protein [Oscillospiraceae bacterium]|nr:YcxB family protein [Oscillospiraceae bacterium]
MTYIFALCPVADEHMLTQLDAVLGRREELLEREQLPNVWRAIEKLEIAAPREAGGGMRRRRLRYRTLGAMLLLLGALLAIPELFELRELSVSLIVGVLAIVWGLFALVGQDRREAPKQKPPETAAQQLLHALGGVGRSGAYAIFSEDALAVETPDGERVEIGYAALEAVLETRDLLFLSDAAYAVTLQKRELSWGEWAEFRDFLVEKADVAIVPHGK